MNERDQDDLRFKNGRDQDDLRFIIIIDNFCIALFSGVHKLTVLYKLMNKCDQDDLRFSLQMERVQQESIIGSRYSIPFMLFLLP